MEKRRGCVVRDYAKVGPQFWIGDTGRKLRAAGANAQVVALYLMTSPHANMLGLYYLPKLFVAHETGLGMEGASEGLARCVEAGYCSYDEASEMVWVHEMASYQIAEALVTTDKRCLGVQNEYNQLPENPYLARFFDKYSAAFHMTKQRGIVEKKEEVKQAPSKPLASQEQEQEQEQEKEQEEEAPPASRSASSQGSRLQNDWALPKAWGEWALEQQPTWTAEHVRLVADKFRDHWIGKSGKDARKADWQATWRNWVRNEKPIAAAKSGSTQLGKAGQATAINAAKWLEESNASN
jgi:hypothetical protein